MEYGHDRESKSKSLPSFFPPTKSIPSSIARSINGLTAPVCSLTSLARAQRASDTDWGSNFGRFDPFVAEDDDDGEGWEEEGEWGGANVARTSRISSSYCLC